MVVPTRPCQLGLARRALVLACVARGLALTDKPVLDCTEYSVLCPDYQLFRCPQAVSHCTAHLFRRNCKADCFPRKCIISSASLLALSGYIAQRENRVTSRGTSWLVRENPCMMRGPQPLNMVFSDPSSPMSFWSRVRLWATAN
jgi:hypothetical protein